MKAIEQYFQVVLFVFDNFAKWNSRFFPLFWTWHSWESKGYINWLVLLLRPVRALYFTFQCYFLLDRQSALWQNCYRTVAWYVLCLEFAVHICITILCYKHKRKFGRMRNPMGMQAIGKCFHSYLSSPKLSQVFLILLFLIIDY